MKRISKVDWARLAAFIDGEGCIDIHEGKHPSGKANYYLRVNISNTDPRLSEWCKSKFGGCVTVNRQVSTRWKANLSWLVAAKSAAVVLRECLPYFVIKREQAEVGLLFQKTIRRIGVKGHPEETYTLRRIYKAKLSELKNRGNVWTAKFPQIAAKNEPSMTIN